MLSENKGGMTTLYISLMGEQYRIGLCYLASFEFFVGYFLNDTLIWYLLDVKS